MKIEDNRNKIIIAYFEDIQSNQIFEYEDELFLKLSETVFDKDGQECNTVKLSTGITFPFKNNDKCILLRSRLVIDEYIT